MDWINWDLAINRKYYINMKIPVSAVSGIILAVIIFSDCATIKDDRSADILLERKVDSVLSLMTLEEKLGQLTLYTSDWDVTGPVMNPEYREDIRTGKCGNVFNALTVEYIRELQKFAVRNPPGNTIVIWIRRSARIQNYLPYSTCGGLFMEY